MLYSNLNVSAIVLHINGLRALSKGPNLSGWIKGQNPTVGCLQRPHLKHKDTRSRASLVCPCAELLQQRAVTLWGISGRDCGPRTPSPPRRPPFCWTVWALLRCRQAEAGPSHLPASQRPRAGGVGGPPGTLTRGSSVGAKVLCPHLQTPGIPEFQRPLGFSHQSDPISSRSSWRWTRDQTPTLHTDCSPNQRF